MIPGYKGQFKGRGKKLGFQKRNQHVNKIPIKIARPSQGTTTEFKSELKKNIFRGDNSIQNNGYENPNDKKLLTPEQYEDIDFAGKFKKKLQQELKDKI